MTPSVSFSGGWIRVTHVLKVKRRKKVFAEHKPMTAKSQDSPNKLSNSGEKNSNKSLKTKLTQMCGSLFPDGFGSSVEYFSMYISY